MQSLRRAALLGVVPVLFALSARAQFTAVYNFGTALTDTPSVANVTFNPITATNVTATYSSSNANFTSNQWTTAGGSPDTAEHLSFTLQVSSGYTLSLTSFSLQASRSGTGPANISVELFVGGVSQATSSTFSPTNTTSTATSGMSTHTFDFGDLTSIAATSLVEFRIYGWGGTGSTGNLRLDDLTVNGSATSAIPEPSTYAAIAGACALGAAVWQRRRRSKGAA